MLRHRKYKTPIWSKGTYYVWADYGLGPMRTRCWVKYGDGTITYHPGDPANVDFTLGRWVCGDDGYMKRIEDRFCFAKAPKILKDAWEKPYTFEDRSNG